MKNKLLKNSIPINKNLLNKYLNINEVLVQNKFNFNDYLKIPRLTKNIDIKKLNILKMSENELFRLAKEIFYNNNSSSIFYNENNLIYVSNQDIKESIRKVLVNSKQKAFLLEHLQIFAELGKIIEHAKLVAQASEYKNRNDNVLWSYYIDSLLINNRKYFFEFDVISRLDGENHYRVQRLILQDEKTSVSTSSTDKGT